MLRKFCQYLALFCFFILGSYRGYIAIWANANEEPVKVFPYSVQSLPPADQKKLQNGIEINSVDQLQQLLQDYLS